MTNLSTFSYRAFLSYSHLDARYANWLHSALESFPIAKELIGRETAAGPVPKSLQPIFRDRDDFSAGPPLKDQTQKALERSQFLLVLCSPNAAMSPYVDEEIRQFKSLGRATSIIPIIIAGDPADPKGQCYPPSLRFKVQPNGILGDEEEQPIAADARPQGDGEEVAVRKVAAGLLGLNLDDLARSGRVRIKRAVVRCHGTKFNVPNRSGFWNSLYEQANIRFYLVGKTNKSWITRNAEQSNAFGASILRIISGGGDVKILSESDASVVNDTRTFIVDYVVSQLKAFPDIRRNNIVSRLESSFVYATSDSSHYRAVVSDDRLVFIPSLNSVRFRDDAIVFELTKQSAPFEFDTYMSDVDRMFDDESTRIVINWRDSN